MSASCDAGGPGAVAPGRARRRGPSALALLVLTAGPFLPVTPASGQSGFERLFEGCAQGAPSLEGSCGDAALALQAIHGGVGLLMTAGGPIPASPSTAGRRLGTQSRIVVDGGLSWVSFRHPDLGLRAPEGRADRRSLLVGGRLSSAVGIFEGFSPAPNVGGVLAVDAVGTVQLLRHPEGIGSTGSLFQWGGGVRLGVFRESFTLPGLTLSAMHYRAGRFRYGDIEETGAEISLSPRATSLRAVLGRDLLAVGLTGGVGWDRYGGSGRIQASTSGAALPPAAGERESLHMTRGYLFAGANFTWVVTQFAGELVWAWTGSPLEEFPGTGGHRPGNRELQGVVTFRFTY